MDIKEMKDAMQKITMPEDMRERVIKDCRSNAGRPVRKYSRAACLAMLCIVLVACSAAAKYVVDAASTAEASAYQGPASVDLMPIDWTFTQEDVPVMIEKLSESDYLAVYADSELLLRVTQDGTVESSTDAGTAWTVCETEEVPADDFSIWLYAHDPIPGYSMKGLQNRLSNGALVKHYSIEENTKEFYFVFDGNWVQIELVQRLNIKSMLLDGQRLMVTSDHMPFKVSDDLTASFQELLVSSGILTEKDAKKEVSAVIKHIKSHA